MSNGSKNDLDKNLRANNCAMQTEQMAANFVKKNWTKYLFFRIYDCIEVADSIQNIKKTPHESYDWIK